MLDRGDVVYIYPEIKKSIYHKNAGSSIKYTRSNNQRDPCKEDIHHTYQLMCKVFRDMQDITFPPRGKLRSFLPKVFKTLKDVRCGCVVDCTEFRVETSRNFARQGNTYPHTNIQIHLNASLPSHQMVVHALFQICLKETLMASRFFKNVA